MDIVLREPYIDYRKPAITREDYIVHRDFHSLTMQNKSYIQITRKNDMTDVFPKASDYSFEVNGKLYTVPVALKHIAHQIEEAGIILAYEDDWDDEGAIATDVGTFEKAVNFVIQYSVFVYNNYAIILKEPYIDILRDGSVSVHWEAAKNTQLLIIFKKEENELAYFYAEQGDRKIPFKSAIIPGEPVDETLALWMKNHLH